METLLSWGVCSGSGMEVEWLRDRDSMMMNRT
jgi:hypothetical protein